MVRPHSRWFIDEAGFGSRPQGGWPVTRSVGTSALIVLAALFSACLLPSAGLSGLISLKNTLSARSGTDLHRDDSPESRAFGRVRLTPEAGLELSERASAVLSLRADYFREERLEAKELRLWEAFLTFGGEHWDLSLGRRILRWGKADEVSPVDVVNPQDLTELMFLRLEERKRPVPLVRLRVFREASTLEAVFVPGAYMHRRELFEGDWAVLGPAGKELLAALGGGLKVKGPSSRWALEESELGVRLTGSAEVLDYGVSVYYGHDRSPYPAFKGIPKGLVRVEDPGEVGLQDLLPLLAALPREGLRLASPRDTVVGLELEGVRGAWGLRAEAAWHSGRVFLRNDLGWTRKGWVQYVIGADRLFGGGAYLDLQFVGSVILGSDEGLLFDREVESGLTLRCSKEFSEGRFELRFDGLYNLTTRMWYGNPEARWKPWDGFVLRAGVHLLDGPDKTFFDLFDGNDEAYLGVEWTI